MPVGRSPEEPPREASGDVFAVLDVLLGLAIGTLLGLLGAGGSILAVPALVYGAGESLAVAIPTSLLVVAASSVTAVLPRLRARQVQWRIAGIVGGTGAVTAFAGAAVNRALNPTAVLVGLAVLMLFAGWRMLQPIGEADGDCALPGGRVHWRGCLPRSVAVGAAVGFLTGLFGVGGGFVLIPALTLLLGLSMPVATGTSLVIVTVNAAAGLVAHASDNSSLDVKTAAVFTVAAVMAALVAGRIATRLPADRLRRWFAWLVIAVAAYVAARVAAA